MKNFLILVDAPDFKYELAGARMLGYDIGMTFSGQSRTLAANILQRETEAQGRLAFISAMPMAAEEALLLVEHVAKGLNDSIAPR